MGRHEPSLTELGRRLADAQDEAVAGYDLDAAKKRLLAARSEVAPAAAPARPARLETAPRRTRAIWAAGAIAALAVAAGVGLVVLPGRGPEAPRPVAITEGGAPLGSFIAASNEEVPLRFSDGTAVRLGPHARARVVELDAAGARLVLERGRSQVDVVPREGARWRVGAGPFEVAVTAGRTEIAWDPTEETLAVTQGDGASEITAPCLPRPRLVGAGESVRASCPSGKVERVAGPSPSSSAVAAPADPPDRDPPPRWRSLALRGEAARAVREVEKAGFAAECERSSPAELLALAKAARDAKVAPRAREALVALRKRFPQSPLAVTAALELGQTALEALECRDAAEWFATVLREQPDGPLAMGATAGSIEAHAHVGDRAAARRDAEAYLARWPSGPSAALARRTLDDPAR